MGHAPWFEQWEQEHHTVRESVGLMDMSFMAKFHVRGPGAGLLLDRLSAGAVNGDPGIITYTQWLNHDGRIEADLTVTKLDEDDFLVVASDTAHGHVRARLHRFADPVRVDHRRDGRLRAAQRAGTAVPRGPRRAHRR